MGMVLALTSGKGGVGKSTVSVGLGWAFALKGKKVLLVDMDEGLRCLDLMLGVDESTVFDLSDVLMGKEIEDAVYACGFCEGLYLIPAPQKLGTIDDFNFANFANKVNEIYDVVIFDFPAGIHTALYTCLPKDTTFLTVAVPDPVSIRDAAAIGNQLISRELKTRLIINRFILKEAKKYKFKNIDSIIDSSLLQLIGIIPESDELTVLSVKHRLKRKGKAMMSFMRITDRLEGKRVLLPRLRKI